MYRFNSSLYQNIIKNIRREARPVIIKFAFKACERVSLSWTSVFNTLLIISINFKEFILSLDKIFHYFANIYFGNMPFEVGHWGEIESHGTVSYPCIF
jgi:hypothetical protein